MSKFLGFLLGIVAALAGPAAFGVLTADGGLELNAKEMALAYGIGALIFWAVVSYFSGAAALGAALTFGAMIYTVHWIPNRTTNFLNDVPGVTTGMIDGIKTYTLNGLVPVLAVISLVYAVQQMVQAVRRRRRERAEAERRQREQEAAQAQQEAEVAAVYAAPVAAAEYAPAENRFQSFGNTSYDDLFDDEPEPVQPRSQADEHTMQFAEADRPVERENTAVVGAVSNQSDETVQAEPEQQAQQPQQPAEQPEQQAEQQQQQQQADADADETQIVAAEPKQTEPIAPESDETQVVAADSEQTRVVPGDPEATQPVPVAEVPKKDEDGEPPAAGATAMGAAPVAAPVVGAPQQEQPEPPKADEPKAEAPKPEAPKAQTPKAPEAPTQQSFVRPKEEVGQQYRERMDDPEDTGEFFVGQFRPAGA
ncbi:hypothetical protein [Kribbella sp. NPDC051770]|uniref:hypothetical protein n=1 Tax=Kribbella sp. NPDC051770 TaxID=3155413 RepID=UPI00343D162C